MDIVKFKREQEQHRLHLQRIRNVTAVLDSSTPESLGLQHLAVRPKKQQLIEDRRQAVAKENAKLMGLMTKIMNDKRPQPSYVRPSSLNEVERKLNVDRLNFENNLMLERLRTVPPVISKNALEDDYQRHLKAEANLRRRQMKPMSLPKDFHKVDTKSSLFDASTYTAQQSNYSTNADSINSPIRTMTDFRKHVISTKKSSGSISDVPFGVKSTSSHNGGSLFELDHVPH